MDTACCYTKLFFFFNLPEKRKRKYIYLLHDNKRKITLTGYILCFVLCSITLKSKLTENLVQHFYSLTKHFNQYAQVSIFLLSNAWCSCNMQFNYSVILRSNLESCGLLIKFFRNICHTSTEQLYTRYTCYSWQIQ